MSNNPHGRQFLSLLGFAGVSFGAAALGSIVTRPALDTWYRKLRKPKWTPPDWVFGPVWTTLYIQIAVSGWLVYRHILGQPRAQRSLGRFALVAWGAQLVLNVGWSAAFFGRRSPGAGLVGIALFMQTYEYRPDRWPEQPKAGPFFANLAGFLAGLLYGLPGLRIDGPDLNSWPSRPIVHARASSCTRAAHRKHVA